MSKQVLIIGTGLGGLATALRLAHRGYKVTMVEKHHQAGGRLNQIKKDGFTFDTGPSFFSMSYDFETESFVEVIAITQEVMMRITTKMEKTMITSM